KYQRSHDDDRQTSLPDGDQNGESPRAKDVADWIDLAEEQVLRSQLRSREMRAILALPAIYRAPVMLRDIHGMSTEEASAMLHVKEQTRKSGLPRGRLMLRKPLADFGGGLSLHRPIYGTEGAGGAFLPVQPYSDIAFSSATLSTTLNDGVTTSTM